MNKANPILDHAMKAAVRDAHEFAGAVAIAPTPAKEEVKVEDSTDWQIVGDDYVIVRPDKVIEKVGELYVPAKGDERATGTVLAAPASSVLKVGDKILYSRMAQYSAEGKNVFIVRFVDVVARKAAPVESQ